MSKVKEFLEKLDKLSKQLDTVIKDREDENKLLLQLFQELLFGKEDDKTNEIEHIDDQEPETDDQPQETSDDQPQETSDEQESETEQEPEIEDETQESSDEQEPDTEDETQESSVENELLNTLYRVEKKIDKLESGNNVNKTNKDDEVTVGSSDSEEESDETSDAGEPSGKNDASSKMNSMKSPKTPKTKAKGKYAWVGRIFKFIGKIGKFIGKIVKVVGGWIGLLISLGIKLLKILTTERDKIPLLISGILLLVYKIKRWFESLFSNLWNWITGRDDDEQQNPQQENNPTGDGTIGSINTSTSVESAKVSNTYSVNSNMDGGVRISTSSVSNLSKSNMTPSHSTPVTAPTVTGTSNWRSSLSKPKETTNEKTSESPQSSTINKTDVFITTNVYRVIKDEEIG